MLNQLQNDDTPFEYSMSAIELGSVRCRLFIQNLAFNNSLLQLDMTRKDITDQDGIDIGKMLKTNKKLRTLVLEGNKLGPKSMIQIGEALNRNITLLNLHLGSNNLSSEGQEPDGFCKFCDCLPNNYHLLSLNISNNNLDE